MSPFLMEEDLPFYSLFRDRLLNSIAKEKAKPYSCTEDRLTGILI